MTPRSTAAAIGNVSHEADRSNESADDISSIKHADAASHEQEQEEVVLDRDTSDQFAGGQPEDDGGRDVSDEIDPIENLKISFDHVDQDQDGYAKASLLRLPAVPAVVDDVLVSVLRYIELCQFTDLIRILRTKSGVRNGGDYDAAESLAKQGYAALGKSQDALLRFSHVIEWFEEIYAEIEVFPEETADSDTSSTSPVATARGNLHQASASAPLKETSSIYANALVRCSDCYACNPLYVGLFTCVVVYMQANILQRSIQGGSGSTQSTARTRISESKFSQSSSSSDASQAARAALTAASKVSNTVESKVARNAGSQRDPLAAARAAAAAAAAYLNTDTGAPLAMKSKAYAAALERVSFGDKETEQ